LEEVKIRVYDLEERDWSEIEGLKIKNLTVSSRDIQITLENDYVIEVDIIFGGECLDIKYGKMNFRKEVS